MEITEMSFIYGLICPLENNIRYIGAAKDVEKRIKDHIVDTQGKSKKQIWIKGLRKKGLKPTIKILDIVEDKGRLVFEKQYVKLYIKNGFDLLNKAEYKQAPEKKHKIEYGYIIKNEKIVKVRKINKKIRLKEYLKNYE